jgi:tetratricopeptide (TPR) repeat protein
VTLQIGASYPSKRLVRREKATARTIAYAPGAIDWSLGMDQAAAWVTPRDPAVDELARQVGRLALQRGERVFGSRNVTFCAAMIDALRELGCAYVPDPTNPFSAVSGTPHAVDTIHYPYQTLDRLSGDCDDTSVLMASLLGNVGVATQFVDAPGHILLIADSGLHESHREALGVDSTMVVVRDGRVWVPIETTQLAQGFAAAWRAGAEVVASASQRGALGFVDVTRSQERYEPALPPGERKIRLVDESRFLALLDADATEVTRARDAFFRERYGASGADLEASASALELVARITFEGGDLVGARTQLEQALLRSPNSVMLHNDLGVVLAGLGEASSATDHWRTALALDPREAAPALNLGWVTLLGGDSASAMPLLASGVAVAGGYEAACARLSLPPVATAGAGGSDGNALQERLRAALREAAAPARPGGRVVPGPSAAKRLQLPLGFTGMSLNLAWME